MIPKEAKLEIIRKRQEGESWTAIAVWVGETYGIKVHRSTIRRWYDKEGCQESEVDKPDIEQIKIDKKLNTYKTEAAYYKKLYEQMIAESSYEDLFINTIKELTPAFKNFELIQPLKFQQGFKRGSHPQSVMAPLADTHIGDNVDYNQMAGLNSYDIEIFNQRLYGWATQVLALVEYRRSFTDIPELVVPLLGDMVSGDIHEELATTNLDTCMGQMIRGANLIAQALMFLAPHFEIVRVPCVVGNHGRLTKKIPSKNKYINWDYMMYQWIAAFCSNQTNIKFEIPKSLFHVFEICNRKILMLHGDTFKGSSPDIIKNVTAMRAVLQYRNTLEEEAIIEENDSWVNQFDSTIIGHFHRVDEIDIGTGEVHICGCMKGGDEYALGQLSVITKPKQIVTYWHPKYGYIGKEVVYLNRYDNSPNSFIDKLGPVWGMKNS